MEIELDMNKSIEQNAELYFNHSKKFKKKIEGAEVALEDTKKKLAKLKTEKEKFMAEQEVEREIKGRKKHWYEKFRWFISSTGFLVIGGRDATSNEIVIKKHAEKGDLVFHTDMAGSPFFVIRSEGKEIDDVTIKEAADATCTFSKAFQKGLREQSVFYVKPEQVTKEAQSGEYLPKGAFMIRGETKYIQNTINCAMGLYEGAVMSGPVEAVSKHCEQYVLVDQGDDKVSAIAKKIKAKLGGDLDELVRQLPTGGMKIVKEK